MFGVCACAYEPVFPDMSATPLTFQYPYVGRCAAGAVRGAGGAGRRESVRSLQQPRQSHLRGPGERHNMPDGGVRS